MPEELAILDADESQFVPLLMQLPLKDFIILATRVEDLSERRPIYPNVGREDNGRR